jgi:hypothetical protein
MAGSGLKKGKCSGGDFAGRLNRGLAGFWQVRQRQGSIVACQGKAGASLQFEFRGIPASNVAVKNKKSKLEF